MSVPILILLLGIVKYCPNPSFHKMMGHNFFSFSLYFSRLVFLVKCYWTFNSFVCWILAFRQTMFAIYLMFFFFSFSFYSRGNPFQKRPIVINNNGTRSKWWFINDFTQSFTATITIFIVIMATQNGITGQNQGTTADHCFWCG